MQRLSNLETEFAATVSEILENDSKSFFNQNCRKRYKTRLGFLINKVARRSTTT